MTPQVVMHPVSKVEGQSEAAAFKGVVFPPGGLFKASARAHLNKVSSWWPRRDSRRHFWLYPASESERAAYKALTQDLIDRDRALTIEAGDGEHVFHIIPPTRDMLRKKVVPSQHKTHLTMVYGQETKR